MNKARIIFAFAMIATAIPCVAYLIYAAMQVGI